MARGAERKRIFIEGGAVGPPPGRGERGTEEALFDLPRPEWSRGLCDGSFDPTWIDPIGRIDPSTCPAEAIVLATAIEGAPAAGMRLAMAVARRTAFLQHPEERSYAFDE